MCKVPHLTVCLDWNQDTEDQELSVDLHNVHMCVCKYKTICKALCESTRALHGVKRVTRRTRRDLVLNAEMRGSLRTTIIFMMVRFFFKDISQNFYLSICVIIAYRGTEYNWILQKVKEFGIFWSQCLFFSCVALFMHTLRYRTYGQWWM